MEWWGKGGERGKGGRRLVRQLVVRGEGGGKRRE